MRVFVTAVVAAGMMFLLPASGMTASTAPPALMLEMKGEPGQESRYETKLDVAVDVSVTDPSSGTQIFSLEPRLSGSMVSISRVAAVADNGDLTLAGKVESFDFSLDVADLHARLAIAGPGGGPPQLIKLPEIPIRAVMSKRGALLAVEGLEDLPIPEIPGPTGENIDLQEMMGKILEEFSVPLFPDHPVSVGDSWEWEMVVDPLAMVEMMGTPLPPEAEQQLGGLSFPLKSTSTLVGMETVNGVECAKIEAVAPWELTFPAGPGGATMRESGTTIVTTWLDHAAGRNVKEVTEVALEMTAGQAGMTFMRMDLRISGESELK